MIHLVRHTPRSIELVYEYRQDPVTRQFNPLEAVSFEQLSANIARASHDWADFPPATQFSWAVEENGEIVGNASLKPNAMMLTAEIGYGVLAPYRGRGLASEMVRQLTEEAFARTPLRKLIALVHEENAPSRRALEKNGFLQEGLLREHYLIGGKPVNEVIYGRLR